MKGYIIFHAETGSRAIRVRVLRELNDGEDLEVEFLTDGNFPGGPAFKKGQLGKVSSVCIEKTPFLFN